MVEVARRKGMKAVDFNEIRNQFPAFRDAGLAYHYLDSAASSHKPDSIINAITKAYQTDYAPVHRGLYPQAANASNLYEQSRKTLAQFIKAQHASNIVFTRSATESINLVAQGWAKPRLQASDEIWISEMEHHANYLPWQRVCQQTGAKLRTIPITPDGQLNFDANAVFGNNTKLIALTLVSNVLGTINPLAEIIEGAHQKGIPVLVDAAQALAHLSVDVSEMGCDFLVASAHKMCGPTGIGLLYGIKERLAETEPLLLGGGMVDEVSHDVSTWTDIPARFEAGSPNFSGAIGFAAAAEFLNKIGLDAIKSRVHELTLFAYSVLRNIPGITFYGSPERKNHSAIISFNLDGIHPHDVAQIAGESGVAIRAGHHCCQPLMQQLDVSSTVRVSISFYNNEDDIKALCHALYSAKKLFGDA
jgi:cysteine desulfurase/selenocysteine lyase